MARVYSRKDRKGRKVWYVDFVAPHPRTGIPTRKRERVGYSKEEAKQALQSRVTDIRRGKFDGIFPEPTCSLEEFKDQYLKRHSSRKSDGGERDKSIIDGRLIPAFRKTSLNRITTEQVEDYRSARLADGVGNATINKEVQVLKHMVKKAVEWGKIRTNLVAKVKPLKTPPGRVRYLEQEQVPKLLKACPDWLRPIVVIYLNTGLRRSELLGLQRKDLDRKNGLIRIEKTKNDERKVLPMNATVREVFKSLPARVDTPYLFADEEGKPYTGDKVTMAFRRARKAAGIDDFRLHDLRHHFASYLTMAGQNQRVVQELLGHKTPAMTARYSHLSQETLKEAVGVLDGLKSAARR